MSNRYPFKVGTVVGPNGIHSRGITHGDWARGCEFLQSVRPLITNFVDRFQTAYAAWTEKKVLPGREVDKMQKTKDAARTEGPGVEQL